MGKVASAASHAMPAPDRVRNVRQLMALAFFLRRRDWLGQRTNSFSPGSSPVTVKFLRRLNWRDNIFSSRNRSLLIVGHALEWVDLVLACDSVVLAVGHRGIVAATIRASATASINSRSGNIWGLMGADVETIGLPAG